MLLPTILLFAAGVAAHTGWMIPGDHIEGIYEVTVITANNTSTAVHTLIAGLNEKFTEMNSTLPHSHRTLIPSAKFPRQAPSPANTGPNDIWCPGYLLPHADFDHAYGSLQSQCGDGLQVRDGYDIYAISGDVVAYYCNFMHKAKNNCFAAEVKDAEKKIIMACGKYESACKFFFLFSPPSLAVSGLWSVSNIGS